MLMRLLSHRWVTNNLIHVDTTSGVGIGLWLPDVFLAIDGITGILLLHLSCFFAIIYIGLLVQVITLPCRQIGVYDGVTWLK